MLGDGSCRGVIPWDADAAWHRQNPPGSKSPRILCATNTVNLDLLVLGQSYVGYDISSDSRGTFFIDSKGLIMGLYVADSWTPNSVQMHFAIPNPLVLRHGFLESIYNFVFNVAKRLMIIGITPADNLAALRFAKRVGFVELFRIAEGQAPGVDLVIQQITRDVAARWPEYDHG